MGFVVGIVEVIIEIVCSVNYRRGGVVVNNFLILIENLQLLLDCLLSILKPV